MELDNTVYNMLIMKEIVEGKGIPPGFSVDGEIPFFITRHGGTNMWVKEEQVVKQIERVINESVSNLILVGGPQAKERIARLFRTIHICLSIR